MWDHVHLNRIYKILSHLKYYICDEIFWNNVVIDRGCLGLNIFKESRYLKNCQYVLNKSRYV